MTACEMILVQWCANAAPNKALTRGAKCRAPRTSQVSQMAGGQPVKGVTVIAFVTGDWRAGRTVRLDPLPQLGGGLGRGKRAKIAWHRNAASPSLTSPVSGEEVREGSA